MRTAVLFLLSFAGCWAAENELVARWWRHMSTLADDSMQGRTTGSPGHRKAAEYVAEQLRRVGASGCARGEFLQPIPLASRKVIAEKSGFEVVRGDQALTWKLGQEATLGSRSEEGEFTAPLEFVGYGLSIPSHHYSDLAGRDLKGKIAVYITGSPSHLAGPIRAHFSSRGELAKALREAGARGSLSIPNPKTTDVPWARSVLSWNRPTLTVAGEAGAGVNENRLPFGGSISAERAGVLFESTGHTLEQLLAMATEGKQLPRFTLPGMLRARVAVEQSRLGSENVCGVVRGADAKLRDDYVLLTAHLDHLGVSGAIGGDSIYNGAMDNASGIATLLECARLTAAGKQRLKRPVLFVAVTGEERGMLGSRYFAAHPLIGANAAGAVVANINMDMFLPIHAMKLLMVLGLDESTLKGSVETVAAKWKVKVQRDPEPQRNRFIRSDQYSFILRGVPSVALKIGYEAASAEEAVQKEWIRTRYHAPSDDLTQPVDKEAAALFTRIVADLAIEVAAGEERPRWNESSFFRRFAGR
jgi:hypothetical protein